MLRHWSEAGPGEERRDDILTDNHSDNCLDNIAIDRIRSLHQSQNIILKNKLLCQSYNQCGIECVSISVSALAIVYCVLCQCLF